MTVSARLTRVDRCSAEAEQLSAAVAEYVALALATRDEMEYGDPRREWELADALAFLGGVMRSDAAVSARCTVLARGWR